MALQQNYHFSEKEQESRKESESSPERQVKVCSEAQFWTNWRKEPYTIRTCVQAS